MVGPVDKPSETELPMAAGWGPQRRAAARNHARILAAARELIGSSEADTVEMRDIARAAGVGVGTLYRRFGDKQRLLAELLSEDERQLQDALLAAEPPLGHAAPPHERLLAFLAALVDLTERNLNVLLVTDATPAGRLRIGAYEAWRLHLSNLLGELLPGADVDALGWRADLLLGALEPALYAEQRRRRGLDPDHIAGELGAAALALARGRAAV